MPGPQTDMWELPLQDVGLVHSVSACWRGRSKVTVLEQTAMAAPLPASPHSRTWAGTGRSTPAQLCLNVYDPHHSPSQSPPHYLHLVHTPLLTHSTQDAATPGPTSPAQASSLQGCPRTRLTYFIDITAIPREVFHHASYIVLYSD